MNNQQKSIRNLIYSIVGQIITIVLGLILPRLWIVSYGSEVNGLLSSLSQFLVYLGLFEAGIGVTTLQALYKPVAENNWDNINGILATANFYYKKTGTWYFFGLLILSAIYPLIANSSLPYFTIFGAVFFSGIGNVVLFWFQGKYYYFLQAEGKKYIIANLSTIITILNSIAKVVLISLNINVVIILAVTFFIQCLQAGYIIWYMRRYQKLNLNVPPDYSSLSQKNSVLVHQISSLIFQNTDVLILTFFCNLRVVSVYSLYKLVVTQLENLHRIPFESVSFALGQTFQTDRQKFLYMIDITDSLNSAALYAVFAVTLFLFTPFIQLYTAGVTDINYIDPWLAILFVAIALLDKSRTPMLAVINYAGHFKSTLKASIIESVINLAVSIVGVYFLGIYGVLLGTVAALAYRTNDIILYTNKKILNRSAKKTYAIYLVNIAAFLITQGIFRLIFDGLWIDSYLRFILAGIVCTPIALVVVFGAQLLFFPECRKTVVVFFKQLLKKLHILH